MRAYDLVKIAATSLARRRFFFGLAGAAFPKVPNVVAEGGKIAGKGLVDAWSWGGPKSPLAKVFQATKAVNNGAMSLAQLRAYRIARVGGASRAEAMAKAHIGRRISEVQGMVGKGKDTVIRTGQVESSKFNRSMAGYNALARPYGLPIYNTSLKPKLKPKISLLDRIKRVVTDQHFVGA